MKWEFLNTRYAYRAVVDEFLIFHPVHSEKSENRVETSTLPWFWNLLYSLCPRFNLSLNQMKKHEISTDFP